MSAPIAEADRIALNALVDGALGAAEAAALEARIAAEPALAAARDEIAAVRAALAGLPRGRLRPAFSRGSRRWPPQSPPPSPRQSVPRRTGRCAGRRGPPCPAGARASTG